jgi:hypothetical protein
MLSMVPSRSPANPSLTNLHPFITRADAKVVDRCRVAVDRFGGASKAPRVRL